MFTSILLFLIYVCVAAGLVYLVLWVIKSVAAIPIPAKIEQIIWVIFILLVIYFFVIRVVPHIRL